MDEVKFEWDFDVGSGGIGESQDITVGVGRSAQTSEKITYTDAGRFDLVVVVQDAANDDLLATATAPVQVGKVPTLVSICARTVTFLCLNVETELTIYIADSNNIYSHQRSRLHCRRRSVLR